MERLKTLLRHYWGDYLLFIVLLVVNFIVNPLTPLDRGWMPSDATIAHRYAQNELVPTWLLVVLAIVIPAVILIIIGAIFGGFHGGHHAILGFGISIALTLAVTNSIKNLIGRHRPDFLDRCQPNMNSVNSILSGSGQSNSGVFTVGSVTFFFNSFCTQTDTSVLEDGSRSFPSGHSSIAFAGLFYLTLFFFGIWQTLSRNTKIYAALSNCAQYIKQNHRWARKWIPGFKYSCSFIEDSYTAVCPNSNGFALSDAVQGGSTAKSTTYFSPGTDNIVAVAPSTSSSASSSPTFNGRKLSKNSTADIFLADKSSLHFLFAMIPTFLALFIALSRVHDFRHFWSDAFVGSLIGLIIALTFYHWYHMSLLSPLSGMPKPLRWYPSKASALPLSSGNPVISGTSSSDLLSSKPVQ